MISVLLGHEQLTTTMRYLDISTDDQIKAMATLEDENDSKVSAKWKNNNGSAWLPYIRVTRKNIQYLTNEEVCLIKNACACSESDLPLLCRAVVLLLLYTGLRGCDVAALTLDSILWESSMISLVQKKTSVPLTVPLPTVVGNALYDYLEKERKSDSRSFFITATGKDFKPSDVSYCVKKVFMVAGIRQNKGDRQGSHIFRHHLATSLLEHEVAQPIISHSRLYHRFLVIQTLFPYRLTSVLT